MPSTSKIPRGEFRNPCPDLSNAAAKTAVDSLLSTVTEAHKSFGDPTNEDYEIVSWPLGELQQRIFHGDVTLPRVVEARIRLTIKASLETHCLTAFPYEEALEAAQEYQDSILDTGDNDDFEDLIAQDPLLGLVFSVKDCIHVQGKATTLGCSLRAGHDEAANAEIVQKLLDMGAILIAKTTAPQLMMSNTTHSPLWGTTRSAVHSAQEVTGPNDEFQVGGSSGGEASLVKMGGSQVGIGTDMGGSVRQPACLNELYGYKFASKLARVRWQLPRDFMTGLPHTNVPATAPGLLARDFSSLRAVAEEVYGAKYWNRKPLTEDDFVDTYEDDLQPEPEDLGNNPRIVFSTQHSSPEVQALIHWLVESLSDDDQLSQPTKIDELGDIDLKAWGQAWTEHAKEHGFDDARAMLADDPLINRTLFDELRLSSGADDSSNKANKAEWKPDAEKLENLKTTFLRQASIKIATKKNDSHSDDDQEAENVILITPTYILGGPVQNKSFVELDDAGESEIWCQIFNLLDWPAVSVTVPFPDSLRQQAREQALASPEWAKHLPGLVKADPLDYQSGEDGGDGHDRLPQLSVQFATVPGNQLALLDYVDRII